MSHDYLIPSEIELTEPEIEMLRSHGFTVLQPEKMSKEELQDTYDWLIENGY
jgi:virulence-associated protein VagC